MASTTNDYINTLKYGLMIVIVILCIYIWFFDTNRFCVVTKPIKEDLMQHDPSDIGKKCFKDAKESVEYQNYLIDKYKMNAQSKDFRVNISE